MKINMKAALLCTLMLTIFIATAGHAAPADVSETGVGWW
jgi:hypothetical protein